MRENFWLHKLHSLSGVIPVGFYMLQHLTLNSFALAGREKFDGVIDFFEAWPPHLLLAAELLIILGPILFHAVYGLIIVARMEPYTSPASAKYRENKFYTLQRWSGIVAFFFLCVHVASTVVRHKIQGVDLVKYQAMSEMLRWPNGMHLGLIFYAIGVLACGYHLAYGIWHFCIRWGITIGEKSQMAMARVSLVLFIVITLLGIGSLAGFLKPQGPATVQSAPIQGVTVSLQ